MDRQSLARRAIQTALDAEILAKDGLFPASRVKILETNMLLAALTGAFVNITGGHNPKTGQTE